MESDAVVERSPRRHEAVVWVVAGALLTIVLAYATAGLNSPHWGSPLSHTESIGSHASLMAQLTFMLDDVATHPTALAWFVAQLTLFSALWLTHRVMRLPGERTLSLLSLPWLVAILIAAAGVLMSVEERMFYGGLHHDSGMGDVGGVLATGAAWLAATLCLVAVRGVAHLRRSKVPSWS